MVVEAQLSHRNVRNANLPYVSLLSPTATDPCYVTGSQDIMTSIKGYAERRPGFANVDATGFNNLQRVFTWDRFDGLFFKMYSDINASNQSVVYKFAVGVDVAPVSIYTDTGSNTPFDFIVSNNTVYFSNGHVAQKWDPVNGISNWGIAIGSVNNASGPNVAGAGTDLNNGGIAWTNPNNVTSAVSFATVTQTPVSANFSHQLQAEQFAFAVAPTTTITGIQVSFDQNVTNVGATQRFVVTLLKGGVGAGTSKVVTGTGSTTTANLGGSSDLWGTTFTVNDVNQTTFGVEIETFGSNGINCVYSVRHVQITVFGLGGPSITVSASAGTFSAVTGYQYVFCYGNSNTGHVSSPTPASASTGAFTNKLNVSVALTASTDAQVNQIRVFRSTDSVAAGGVAAQYFELPTSPYANTTTNILDTAVDSTLQTGNIAPSFGFNDPPTPMRAMQYFSGRIWGFANNKTYFSALEECVIGVPEESFPSGVAGNFWSFDQTLKGLAVAGSSDNQTLLNFSGGRIYGIVGNSLDTFRRFTITQRRGCRRLEAITSLGGSVAWLDSASQIWATDGTTTQEIGLPIRPDLANVNPANCSMTFHSANNFHWLVFSNGTQLFVYDMDTEQWMPPWNFAAQYVFSGETSAGSYQLFGAQATTSLTISSTAHNDNGVSYTPIAKTSLMALVPDFGTRFSLAAMGLYDEPSRTGVPYYFQVDTNNVALADFLIATDDDPLNGGTTYTSIFANVKDPSVTFNRTQGTFLVQNIYPVTSPTSRWVSIQWKGATADDGLKVYGHFMAYRQFR